MRAFMELTDEHAYGYGCGADCTARRKKRLANCDLQEQMQKCVESLKDSDDINAASPLKLQPSLLSLALRRRLYSTPQKAAH